MISKDSLHIDWITKVSSANRKADKILVEKVIRALMLLEGLVKQNLDFVFKGGTALMLILDSPKRLSIDIDIIIEKEPKNLDEPTIIKGCLTLAYGLSLRKQKKC